MSGKKTTGVNATHCANCGISLNEIDEQHRVWFDEGKLRSETKRACSIMCGLKLRKQFHKEKHVLKQSNDLRQPDP